MRGVHIAATVAAFLCLAAGAAAQSVQLRISRGFAGGAGASEKSVNSPVRIWACGRDSSTSPCGDTDTSCFASDLCLCSADCTQLLRNSPGGNLQPGTTFVVAGTSGGLDDPVASFSTVTRATALLNLSSGRGLPSLSVGILLNKQTTGTPSVPLTAAERFSANVNANVEVQVSFPTEGACCTPTGFCLLLEAASCTFGYFRGAGTACEGTCEDGAAVGACCLIDATCAVTSFETCGGRFLGAGTTCAAGCVTVAGPEPVAVCELSRTGFAEVPLSPGSAGARIIPIAPGRVALTAGTYVLAFSQTISEQSPDGARQAGFSVQVVTVGTNIGACCLGDGTCVQTSVQDCTTRGGAFAGLNTPCGGDFCDGACCATDGTCLVISRSACVGSGGVFRGALVSCTPTVCAGACCASDGTCTSVAADVCAASAGVFRGVDVACAASTCAGACCLSSGTCVVASVTECVGQGGVFRGALTACGPDSCVGACCAVDGSCRVLSSSACANAGGTWRGLDTTCAAATCPGACCAPSGTCTVVSAAACSSGGGTWRGLDTACGPMTCPGACCGVERGCTVMGLDACVAGGGTYLGFNTTCDGNPCCCRPWDNGTFDQLTAYRSTLGVGQAWTNTTGFGADDFWLMEGEVHLIREVSGRLLSNALVPKALVLVWSDCDGVPSRLVAVAGVGGSTVFAAPTDRLVVTGTVSVVDTGEVFDGRKVLEVRAAFEELALDGGVYHVSIVGYSGTGDPADQFYWGSAGSGVIKGRPGQIAGVDGWLSSADDCCNCTDFNFCVTGESCKVLYDAGGPRLPVGGVDGGSAGLAGFLGSPSIQRAGVAGLQARAAGMLVIPPCTPVPVDLCYVEGWIWSNCPDARLQILNGECRCPNGALPGSPVFVPDRVIDTGIQVTSPSGRVLTLKKVQFFPRTMAAAAALLGGRANPGFNAWFSFYGLDGGNLAAEAYFARAARCGTTCTLLGPDCVRGTPEDPAAWMVNGTPGFDYAFRVAIRREERVSVGGLSEPPCPQDTNRDGIVSVQDLFEYLAIYFQRCP